VDGATVARGNIPIGILSSDSERPGDASSYRRWRPAQRGGRRRPAAAFPALSCQSSESLESSVLARCTAANQYGRYVLDPRLVTHKPARVLPQIEQHPD
jgi:hypothetical protein